MNKTDKEVFQSFAHAQATVTNAVYEHLKQPAFMFCPTEYCARRAVPTVSSSQYLNTIGGKLLPGVEIMWTGMWPFTLYVGFDLIFILHLDLIV